MNRLGRWRLPAVPWIAMVNAALLYSAIGQAQIPIATETLHGAYGTSPNDLVPYKVYTNAIVTVGSIVSVGGTGP